jgi:uroporphyrinogen-III synthase
LETVGVNGKRLAVLHYGERDEALVSAVVAQGARLDELCLYEWLMPVDPETLRNLVREIVAGAVQAVAFTSQVQARHLFRAAGDISLSAELAEALNRRAVTAAIGPVCADALRRLGVHPHVIPARPKMAPFVAELARRFGTRPG